MPFEHKRRKKRQRQRDTEDTDKIVVENKLTVAAAAHNSAERRHFIGRAKAGNAQNQQEEIGKVMRLRRKISIQGQHRCAQEKQRRAGTCADTEKNDLQGLCVAFYDIFVAGCNGFSNHNRGRCRLAD